MRMRLHVNIDRVQLGKIGYQAAPIRQILKLKLSPSEQLLLLNFFSNSPDWKVSINSISKSFGTPKNRSLIKRELNNLVKHGYIKSDENGYTVNLDKIISDYQLNIKADNILTIDIDNTNVSRNTSNDDINNNRGVIASLSGDDSDTTSLSDSNTTTNKINIKEKETNDNQEINPVKEILDFDSNSSVDLGFGFDLEQIALKKPKELIGNNYKLVNVNNVSTVVSKDYYDGISTNQATNTNISSKPTNNYQFLKFNDYQKSKLDLIYMEILNNIPNFRFSTFEMLIYQTTCQELQISNKDENIEQANDFLINSIESNSPYVEQLSDKAIKFLIELKKKHDLKQSQQG